MTVSLFRFPRYCPSCHAPQHVHTDRQGRTRIAASCAGTCRIETAYAASRFRLRNGAELLPDDDSRTSRAASTYQTKGRRAS